ncbi:MAG TPA: hypothetical protein VFG19_12395 [Geobacteraceae bacterium]|nr:hypothetical protein [Geobacteraceae bacterium]
MKKTLLITVFLLIGAAAAQAAGTAPNKELEELYSIYSENKNITDACYELSVAKVLTGAMREGIVSGAADRRKGTACALGITAAEAGIRVTDAASLKKLQDYFRSRIKCAEAEVDLRNAKTALELYYIDKGKYPATLDEILGPYVASFKSKMDYRLENKRRYVVSATNEGCDKTLSISSDSPDISGAGKDGPKDRK